ncbi:uroporphyrinogen-III C-methyltransferase, partial [Aduncisulcus paluster]
LENELGSICHVDMPVVYNTVVGEESADHLKEVLEGDVNGITFTSASTVKNFNALIEKAGLKWPASKCFSIGPKTSQELNKLGIEPVESEHATIDSLVTCVKENLEDENPAK